MRFYEINDLLDSTILCYKWDWIINNNCRLSYLLSVAAKIFPISTKYDILYTTTGSFAFISTSIKDRKYSNQLICGTICCNSCNLTLRYNKLVSCLSCSGNEACNNSILSLVLLCSNYNLTLASFLSNSITFSSSKLAVVLLAPKSTAMLVMYLWYAWRSPALFGFK